jgi:hypothetical protein
MIEEFLKRAIDLNKSGKKLEARQLLQQVVHIDPENDKAWVWLADTYPDDADRIAVLEECLKYNPDNPAVRMWLDFIKPKELTEKPSGTAPAGLPTASARTIPTVQAEPARPAVAPGEKAPGDLPAGVTAVGPQIPPAEVHPEEFSPEVQTATPPAVEQRIPQPMQASEETAPGAQTVMIPVGRPEASPEAAPAASIEDEIARLRIVSLDEATVSLRDRFIAYTWTPKFRYVMYILICMALITIA